MVKSNVKKFISKGMLKECIEYIFEVLDKNQADLNKLEKESISQELILISGKFAMIERDLMLGSIEYEKADMFKVRIGAALLGIISKISNNDTSEISQEPHDSTYLSLIQEYFSSSFELINVQNLKIIIDKEGENFKIIIPESALRSVYEGIINFQYKTKDTKQLLLPNLGLSNSKQIELMNKIFTEKEIELLKLFSQSKLNSSKAAKSLNLSATRLRAHMNIILQKFRQTFGDQMYIGSFRDIVNFYSKMGII